MRYVSARVQEEYREQAYRIYVTDSLRGIPQQRYIDMRFYDMTQSNKQQESGDEIALRVIKNAGLKLAERGSDK